MQSGLPTQHTSLIQLTKQRNLAKSCCRTVGYYVLPVHRTVYFNYDLQRGQCQPRQPSKYVDISAINIQTVYSATHKHVELLPLMRLNL